MEAIFDDLSQAIAAPVQAFRSAIRLRAGIGMAMAGWIGRQSNDATRMDLCIFTAPAASLLRYPPSVRGPAVRSPSVGLPGHLCFSSNGLARRRQ